MTPGFYRFTEKHKNTIADKLNYRPAVLFNYFCHFSQIMIEHGDKASRIHLLAHSGKASDIAHQSGNNLFFPSKNQTVRCLQKLPYDFVRKIPAEGFPQQLVSHFKLAVKTLYLFHSLHGIPELRQLTYITENGNYTDFILSFSEKGCRNIQLLGHFSCEI